MASTDIDPSVRANLLAAADAAYSSSIRWPFDEMCLARWDGFAEATTIVLGIDKADLEEELVRIAGETQREVPHRVN